MTPTTTPADTYGARLEARRADAAALGEKADRISAARLTVFLAGAVLAWGAVFGGWMSAWWIGLPVVAFVTLVAAHDRVLQARGRAERAAAWYEHGLARIEDRWSGLGSTGDRFADAEHLYSQDLDLFGDGSLFQLLNTARTRAGEDTLAAWLLTPADCGDVRSRQAAVRDLLPRLTLRERLAMAGAELRAGAQPTALVAWATGPRRLDGLRPQLAAGAVTLLTVIAVPAWFVSGSLSLPVAALAATLLLTRRYRTRTDDVMRAAGTSAQELTTVGRVCRVLRADTFTAPRLVALRAALGTGGDTGPDTAPGPRVAAGAAGGRMRGVRGGLHDDEDGEIDQAVGRLQRITGMHDWQHNLLFRPIAVLLFWELHCACAVERWRARHGHAVGPWLTRIGEFEALSALAAYAYEHPEDPFPELVDPAGAPVYEAAALAHPLIAAANAVPNDMTLGARGDPASDARRDAAPRVRIVSGSNMSGKTTLLRSVGVSAVMALMGAPVRAAHLRMSPATVCATLRIEESLQAGRSRFYAEVLKLGQTAAAAQAGPILFLFDELFHGTNSHDRREGARGLLRSLLALDAIGLVTTHDLALVEIGDALAPRTRNAHFDDTLVEGAMQFDYRLKPGPVTRSNALAIMRAVGLDIPEDD